MWVGSVEKGPKLNKYIQKPDVTKFKAKNSNRLRKIIDSKRDQFKKKIDQLYFDRSKIEQDLDDYKSQSLESENRKATCFKSDVSEKIGEFVKQKEEREKELEEYIRQQNEAMKQLSEQSQQKQNYSKSYNRENDDYYGGGDEDMYNYDEYEEPRGRKKTNKRKIKPRKKTAKRNYKESYSDDETENDSESSDEEPAKRRKKKKKFFQ